MTVQQLPSLVTRASLVLAPLTHLASALVTASLATGAAAEVTAIGRHPDRYYLFTLLQLVAAALFVPMLLALLQLTRTRSPFAAIVGTGLMQVGALVAVADAGTQLVYWQTGARGADAAQMAALLHRYESAPAAGAIFMVGGLSLIAGSVLLGFALWRARVVPAPLALCLPAGILGAVAAFAAGSRPLLVGASAVLLAGLGAVALRDASAALPAPAAA